MLGPNDSAAFFVSDCAKGGQRSMETCQVNGLEAELSNRRRAFLESKLSLSHKLRVLQYGASVLASGLPGGEPLGGTSCEIEHRCGR